jgi:hypothetical protein
VCVGGRLPGYEEGRGGGDMSGMGVQGQPASMAISLEICPALVAGGGGVTQGWCMGGGNNGWWGGGRGEQEGKAVKQVAAGTHLVRRSGGAQGGGLARRGGEGGEGQGRGGGMQVAVGIKWFMTVDLVRACKKGDAGASSAPPQ